MSALYIPKGAMQTDAKFWQDTASTSRGVMANSPHDSSHRCERRPTVVRGQSARRICVARKRPHCGRATIGLWGSWPALLADIPTFGNVLAISRNAYSVLGSVSEYPEGALIPCGHRGCAVDGSLEFDFRCWRRAIAIVEARPGGWLYAVEFSDSSGDVIHKICLTEQSDFEAFRSWVELNQTAADGSGGVGNSRHGSGLENSLVLSASGAQRLQTEVLRVLFQMAAAQRWAFQAFVGHDGAAQIAQMSPSGFCTDGHWIFAEYMCASRGLRRSSCTAWKKTSSSRPAIPRATSSARWPLQLMRMVKTGMPRSEASPASF